jgi:hypothetical protein
MPRWAFRFLAISSFLSCDDNSHVRDSGRYANYMESFYEKNIYQPPSTHHPNTYISQAGGKKLA